MISQFSVEPARSIELELSTPVFTSWAPLKMRPFGFGLEQGLKGPILWVLSKKVLPLSQPLRAPDSLTASFILGWNQVVLVQKEVAEQGKEVLLSGVSQVSEGHRTSYIVWIIRKSREKSQDLAHSTPEFWVSITHLFASVIVSIIISLVCVTAGRKDLVHLDLFPVLAGLYISLTREPVLQNASLGSKSQKGLAAVEKRP